MRGLLIAFLLVATAQAHAFTVGSGGANTCHEQLTLFPFWELTCDGVECALPPGWLALAPPRPGADTLRAARAFHLLDADAGWQYDLAQLSLVSGVRFNDLHGHGLSQFEELRSVHLSDDFQAEHCLRGRADDDPGGDAAALARCRAFIVGELDAARRGFTDRRLERVGVYLEFYGTVELELWGAFFHLGRAIHALQDLYAHTLRSEDLETILAVANFVECGEHDGPCHSVETDRCAGDAYPLADAAQARTLELLRALLGDGGTDAVLDAAFRHRAGCTAADQYCGTPWYPLAQRDTSTAADLWVPNPFECSVSVGGDGASPWLLLLALLAIRRSAARRRPR